MTRHQRPLAALLLGLLALAAVPVPCAAAGRKLPAKSKAQAAATSKGKAASAPQVKKVTSKSAPTSPPPPVLLDPVELVPEYRKTWYNNEVFYQIPKNPIGTVVLLHGCAHGAGDFWPKSWKCPSKCRGLPMEIAHTKQALARGYAVLAISSADRDMKCFIWWKDNWSVAAIINDFKAEQGLINLPVYAIGVSSGGAFALKLPRMTRIDGVVSEAIGVTVADWGMQNVQPAFPPTIFMKMPKDKKTVEKIDLNVGVLAHFGVQHSVITLLERPIYPAYFSDMSPEIAPWKSARLFYGLQQIGMVGPDGRVTQDPRYTKKPWQKELAAAIPDVIIPDDLQEDGSHVYELMNVAWAWHEINGEYTTACLAWLELRGTVPMEQLVTQFKITGRLADLRADRYPLGGKPAQAGSAKVTTASIVAHDKIYQYGQGVYEAGDGGVHQQSMDTSGAPAVEPELLDHQAWLMADRKPENIKYPTGSPSGSDEPNEEEQQQPNGAALNAAVLAPAPSPATAVAAPTSAPSAAAAPSVAPVVEVASSAAWSTGSSSSSATWSLVVAVVAAFLLITT